MNLSFLYFLCSIFFLIYIIFFSLTSIQSIFFFIFFFLHFILYFFSCSMIASFNNFETCVQSIHFYLDCRLGRPKDRPFVRSQLFRSMIRRNRSTNSPSWFQNRFFTLYRYDTGAFLLLFFPRESPSANALAARELLVTSPTHMYIHSHLCGCSVYTRTGWGIRLYGERSVCSM